MSISVAFVNVPITPYVSKVGNIYIAQPTYATANHHIIARSHLPINYTSNVPNYTLFLWLRELFILSRDRKKIDRLLKLCYYLIINIKKLFTILLSFHFYLFLVFTLSLTHFLYILD